MRRNIRKSCKEHSGVLDNDLKSGYTERALDMELLRCCRRENTTMHTGSTFIVMRGYPGTGKSTIARLLAAALHAPLIDRDIIRQTAVDLLGDVPQVGHLSYELMFALVREQLRLGLGAVADSLLSPIAQPTNNAKRWHK